MEKKDYHNIPYHKRPISPDRELLLWEKWIKIRRDETSEIGDSLQRPPVDLAMNLLANVREDKERKLALEHAQIEKITGVRGSLWIRPPRLKQHCYCAPVYELHRTRAEKGRPTKVEHFGVPVYVRKTEMGMAGESLRPPCLHLNADYKSYRQKRELELHEKIKNIDPHRPDIDGLMIRGRNFPTPPPKLPPLPEITLDDVENIPTKPLSGVYALKINNTVLYKAIPGQNLDVLSSFEFHEEETEVHCTTWTYYFQVPAKRAGRCKLFLQNLGTVTLRYCWKKIKRIIPFIPEDPYEQVFFFNKNEDVISPGQTKYVYFTFVADSPGIFSEFWELSMSNVNFFGDSGTKLVVNLYANSITDERNIIKEIDILKTNINCRVVYNFICEIFEEILEKVFEVVPQIYPYKKYFVEAEIFVMKNLVCFYHQTEVNKMKELYTEMVKGEVWDLSIGSWRLKMMAKDFDDRMKYYELLQHSHAELLKPWYEGDGLIKEKLRTVKCLLGQLANLFDKEYSRATESFMETLEMPPMVVPAVNNSMEPIKILASKSKLSVSESINDQMWHNVFYLRMYDHLVTTIELCAGVLSSLDLNRWIEFDFCRH